MGTSKNPVYCVAPHSNAHLFIGQPHRAAPTFSHDALSTKFLEVPYRHSNGNAQKKHWQYGIRRIIF